jgi:hypothetical protein
MEKAGTTVLLLLARKLVFMVLFLSLAGFLMMKKWVLFSFGIVFIGWQDS